ncbi:MAG: B12-binding domain-containing radical SAM protein, partial [Oscillospiraceae bacterium]|nr:B12-binding domain-containing radical SAM protein [Oscillospiraceae bacterium]
MQNLRVLLINFYSPKSLGLRFLERALSAAGFDVTVLYFKNFHSTHPQKPTETEKKLLLDFLAQYNPLFVGFSVMSSLYLEAVEDVARLVREQIKAPLVWGGVYATMFPERCLKHCDYVLRGEGEGAVTELAQRLKSGESLDDMENLAYMRSGEAVVNPVRPLVTDLDTLPMAEIGLDNKYFIDGGELRFGDPMLTSVSYETTCSRGCPFVCSYCSTVGIKRVYRDSRHFLRFRSVDNVITELLHAKDKMKRLSIIHFWDEIFPDDQKWINEFTARYKNEINLPFEIWAHPLKTSHELIQKLRKAGLFQAVMGIQSGSPEVRKKIFHRVESQEQVMSAAKALADNKVPRVIYDFILRHPFESTEQLKETYALCDALPGRFTLQLHDLNFLPGTDIVQEALKRGLYTEAEMEEILYAPMEKQYATWWESGSSNPETVFWYNLIYMTQFKSLRR